MLIKTKALAVAAVLASLAVFAQREAGEPTPWQTWNVSPDAHEQDVSCAAFSPDGRTLATAGREGMIKLWDLASNRMRATLREHHQPVNVLAFSPDGRWLASGTGVGRTGEAMEWDTTTGQVHARLKGTSGAIRSLVFSKDGRTLVAGCEGGRVVRWEASNGELRSTHQLGDHQVRRTAVSSDGRTAATDSRPSQGPAFVTIWDLDTGREQAVLEAPENRIGALVFSNDGSMLAAGSGRSAESTGRDPDRDLPSEVRVWDLSGPKPVERARLVGGAFRVEHLAFAPDGRTLASSEIFGTVLLRDIASGRPRKSFQGEQNHSGVPLAFSPDGTTLAECGRYVTLRDTETGAVRATIGPRWVYAVAYSPDGQTLAAALDDGTVALRDVPTGRVRLVMQATPARAACLAFAPDGRTLAAGNLDGTVSLWDPTTGLTHGSFYSRGGEALAIAYSPDGKTVAAGGGDGTVMLWSTTSHRCQAILRGHRSIVQGLARIHSLAFSPDGKTLVSGSNTGVVQLWDVPSLELRKTITGPTIPVNRAQERTILKDGFEVSAIIPNTGAPVDEPVAVQAVAFAPDGKALAVGYTSFQRPGQTTLLDPATGREMRTLIQPKDAYNSASLYALAFSPDGRLLATGLYSGVAIWDVATGQLQDVLARPMIGPVRGLAFAPDGASLAHCAERFIFLWKLSD
jgi:WD40 repeat protein